MQNLVHKIKDSDSAQTRRIKDIISTWWLGGKDQLLFDIYLTHRIIRNDEGTDTIRVGQGQLQFNEAYVKSLSNSELTRKLVIEGIRIMLKHPYARRKPDPIRGFISSELVLGEYIGAPDEFINPEVVFKSQLTTSMTADMVKFKKLFEEEISGTALSDEEVKDLYGKTPMELQALYGKLPNIEPKDIKKRHLEYYYAQLPSLPKEEMNSLIQELEENLTQGQEQESDGQGKESEGQGQESNGQGKESEGQGKESKEKSKGGKSKIIQQSELWENDPIKEQEINSKIKEAITNPKLWGSVPAGLQGKIIAELTPKADYKKAMSIFKKDIISSDFTLTRTRISRRNKLCMGRKYAFTCNLLWFGDTSMSISEKSLRVQLAYVVKFFDFGIKSIKAFCFDTKIYPIAEIKQPVFKMNIKGRGGTCISEVLKQIVKEPDFGGAIITTDGYFGDPRQQLTKPEQAKLKQIKNKILFVYENEECYNTHKNSFQKEIGRLSFVVPK